MPQKLPERCEEGINFCPYHDSNLDHPTSTKDAIPTMLSRHLKRHPRTGQKGPDLTALPTIRNPVPTVWGMGGPKGWSGLLQKI